MAVCADFWGDDAVENDDAIVGEHGLGHCHDFFEMPSVAADEDSVGAGQRGDVCLHEIAHVKVEARSVETAGVFVDDGFAFGTNFEGMDVEVGKLQVRFDGDRACAGPDVPKGVSVGEVECLEREEADGHLGDHFLTSVEEGKLTVWQAPSALMISCENETVGLLKCVLGCLLQRAGRNPFKGRVAEVFAHMHMVVAKAVVVHALGYGGRGMFLVGEHSYFGGTFDEGAVELLPRTACEGDDAEVVVREKETVGEELEGIEGWEHRDVRTGKLAPERVGEAEEERVA